GRELFDASRDVLAEKHGHGLANRDLLTVGGDNQEAVRSGKGGDVAGTAPFDRGDLRVKSLPFDSSRDEMGQSGLLFDRSGERGAKKRQRPRVGAVQQIDRGPDEKLERDHGRDRIAWKAKNEFVFAARENRGLAGANRDSVEEDLGTERLQHGLNEIVLP